MPTSDKVHFEYGTGAREYAQKNLIAFQRLWNRHNPTAKIAEDGIYGPATGNALSKSPCNGWAAAVSEVETIPIENEQILLAQEVLDVARMMEAQAEFDRYHF